MRINVLCKTYVLPVAMKGSIASKRSNPHCFETQRAVWDEQYALRPSWWKGPYDITPIIQLVRRGAAVLDVGCGTGRYLVPLHRSGFAVTGVDLSKVALSLLDPHYSRVVADVQNLPFVDSTFDAVTCYGVLHHLTRAGRERAVEELFRVVRHEGLAFVEVVGRRDMRHNSNGEIETDTIVRGGILQHYFLPSELSTLFESAGFRTVLLDDRIVAKSYGGVKRTRHRIMIVAMKARSI
ncbi:MAG: class I SAM-dependent methyltransferase [Halobacteriota archaeon]